MFENKKIKTKSAWRTIWNQKIQPYLILLTMSLNLLIGLGKIVMGIMSIQIFFVISGIFTFALGTCKTIYLVGIKKSQINNRKAQTYYLINAIILLVASLLFIICMARLFFVSQVIKLNPIIGICIATFAFTELIIAIIALVRNKVNKDLLLSGLKVVNLVSALTAIVLTQVVLLSLTIPSASDYMSQNTANALGGTIFGLICVSLSIIMIVNYLKESIGTSNPQKLLMFNQQWTCATCETIYFYQKKTCKNCRTKTLVSLHEYNNIDNVYKIIKIPNWYEAEIIAKYQEFGYQQVIPEKQLRRNGSAIFLYANKKHMQNQVACSRLANLNKHVTQLTVLCERITKKAIAFLIFTNILAAGLIIFSLWFTIYFSSILVFIIGTILILTSILISLFALVGYYIICNHQKSKYDDKLKLLKSEIRQS